MLNYKHPGVYIEEVPSASRPIAAAGTSTPIFAGWTESGPIGKPKYILKWADYVEKYGGIQSGADFMGLAINSYFMNGGGPAYVARLSGGATKAKATLENGAGVPLIDFEANNAGVGGNDIFLVISVLDSVARTFTLSAFDEDGLLLENREDLRMNPTETDFFGNVLVDPDSIISGTAASNTIVGEGSVTSGELSVIELDAVKNSAALALPINILDFSIKIDGAQDALSFKVNLEDFDVLSATPIGDRIDAVVAALEAAAIEPDDGSIAALGTTLGDKVVVERVGTKKIVIKSTSTGPEASVEVSKPLAVTLLLTGTAATPSFGDTSFMPPALGDPTDETVPRLQLQDGADGSAPGQQAYKDLFDGPMMVIRDISTIVLPGETYSLNPGNPNIDAAIAHCETTKSRMVIVDPPAGKELMTASDLGTPSSALPTSTYSVLYYPWLSVPNSLYDPEDPTAAPKSVLVPPSGAAAGMWAKTDAKRGVWKAPAGVATGLLGISGTQYEIPDATQDQLNEEGVNCIRNIPRFNYVFWGARTLATNSAPEWRYVPIRRTAIMIERSIYDGIQWAVFEPNNHMLWASLRLNIGNFMDGLHRAGAFQGEKASDAYFVNCGLDDTMTQADIDNGQVIVEVGFAPLKPAEFVIVRIQQIVGQAR